MQQVDVYWSADAESAEAEYILRVKLLIDKKKNSC